jgi:4'-phosphopantetheinyl transferase
MGSAEPVTTIVSCRMAGCGEPGCGEEACWAHNSPVPAAAMIQNFIGEPTNVASGQGFRPVSGIHVWTIPLDMPGRAEWLSADETIRAARFIFEKDRVRWIRARSALRSVLSNYVNQTPDALRFVYGANGKPGLAGIESGIEFNLSHAGDFGLIAVSDSGPVGIDIERIREGVDIAALLERLGETDLPDTVMELYHRWTRREARSKAVGGQLFTAPPVDVQAVDITAPEGYAASVAASDHRVAER